MSETEYQRCARGLREAAEMARENAEAAMRAGEESAIIGDLERRAVLWESWADRELRIERMMRDLSDDDHEFTAA